MTDRLAPHVEDTEKLELDLAKPRLLAASSRLLYGAVGLNSSERVYDRHPARIIKVPTILLSTLPHYPSVHRVDIPADFIGEALSDLDKIDATAELEIVTAGYFASPAQAERFGQWYEGLTHRPPFILDPTLGDIEVGFYTDPAVAGGVREFLTPLATGATPNIFEVAHTLGEDPEAFDHPQAIIDGARQFMGERSEWVIVTGVHLPDHPGEIAELLVTRDDVTEFTHPELDTAAKGLGDTFNAALCLALLDGNELPDAINTGASAVRELIQARG